MALKSAVRPVASNPTGPLQGDPPPNIPRDQWGRPLVAPLGSSPNEWVTPVAMTRASTQGGTLENQYGLNRWRTRRALWGVVQGDDLILAIRTCDIEDKDRLDDLADQAFERAEGKAKASIGTSLHHVVDRVDRGESIPDLGPYNVTVEAYAGTASHFVFHAIELFVVNYDLGCAGTPDRLCSPLGWMTAPDGTIFGPEDVLVWDLKTSGTADYFGIKFCVQVAVYDGGRPYEHLESRSVGRGKAIEVRGRYLDWPRGQAPNGKWGLICHAPSGGDTADLYWVPLEEGRHLAGMSSEVRGWRKATLIVPAALPVKECPVPILVSGITIESLLDKIIDADSLDTLDRLWTAYGQTEIWTKECDSAAGEVAAAFGEAAQNETRTARTDALIALIREAASEIELDELWDQYGETETWTEECDAEANARWCVLFDESSEDKIPDHVMMLRLKTLIAACASEQEIEKLYADNYTFWNDNAVELNRMADAALISIEAKGV